MSKGEVLLDEHFLLFPYKALAFGYPLEEMVCTVNFSVAELVDDKYQIRFDNIVGEFYNGLTVSMDHLLTEHDTEGSSNSFFLNAVMGNKQFWDKDKPWW